MSRQSVTEFAGGKGPRQLIWEALRRLHLAGQPWSDSDLWSALHRSDRVRISEDAVRDYRRCLQAAGIVAQVSKRSKRNESNTWRLEKDEGAEAPRVRLDGGRVTQGLAQEQMWRTLRIMAGDTNGRELAAHASTPTIPVAEVAARDYLSMLDTAGYLVRTQDGKGTGAGGVQARYRLRPDRNTGPRPPMVCRHKVIYDPNLDQVVWSAPVSDEDAFHGR
jgi:hypothetical protein